MRGYYDFLLTIGIIGIFLMILSIPYFILNAIFNRGENEEISKLIGLLVFLGYYIFVSLLGK